MSLDAMIQAYAALDNSYSYLPEKSGVQRDALQALEVLNQAIAEAQTKKPEPEPVAWFTEDYREDKSATTYSKKMAERWREKGWPVTPLYTAPPQREWQGLTDDELRAAYRKGRDSIPSPDSGWEWVDNHTPGLREVELTLYRKNNNGDVV